MSARAGRRHLLVVKDLQLAPEARAINQADPRGIRVRGIARPCPRQRAHTRNASAAMREIAWATGKCSEWGVDAASCEHTKQAGTKCPGVEKVSQNQTGGSFALLRLLVIVVGFGRIGSLRRRAAREVAHTLALPLGPRLVVTPAAQTDVFSMRALVLAPRLRDPAASDTEEKSNLSIQTDTRRARSDTEDKSNLAKKTRVEQGK